MKARFGAAIALGVMALSAAAWAQGSGDPAANWATIAQCGSIAKASERLDCMDGVLRRAGVLDAARVAQETRREFGRQRAPEPAKAAPPPRPAPTRAAPPAVARTADEQADADELLTTIRAVRVLGFDSLRIVTAEGSVWDQTQNQTFTSQPKVGQAFSVIKGALGSYRCRFAGASRYRCKRAD